MDNYIIIIKNNEQLNDHVQYIVNYLGEGNSFSTCYNFYNKYNLKTRDITFNDYCPRAIDKKIDSIFEIPLIKNLANDIIKSSINHIEATLTIDQINYLKTLPYIENIRLMPKSTLTTLSDNVGDNTKTSFVSNNPNTNNGLQAQNKDFDNYKLGNTQIFNYLESLDNTTYKYNADDPDIEVDIIVIDNGINGNHQNFIIGGKNICQIDRQPNLPWQLSKLYSLSGRDFIPGSTPEGVSQDDPNFVSYFTPTNQNNGNYNHGTHTAGIICGVNTGWIRSNKVNLYSIPYMTTLLTNHLYESLIELSILQFQIDKIRRNIKIPTFVNRSYTILYQVEYLPNFSNFSKIFSTPCFYTVLKNNKLEFGIIPEEFRYPFFHEIQKKFGIVNVFSGGNNTQLQLKWSDNPDNYFNYYEKFSDFNFYPYIPLRTCLKEEYWTIGGKKLSDLNYNSILDVDTIDEFKLEINFHLINETLNQNPKNIYKILNKTPPTIIVGSLANGTQGAFDYLQKEKVGFLSNYVLSGFSSFGDALIYSLGSNIRSSVAYNDKDSIANNFYKNDSGTSMACPNVVGILAKYLMKQYLTLTIEVEKIFMNTNQYIEYYINDNLRNVYKNMDPTIYPDKNSFFYKDVQLWNSLENINQIYPLNMGSQNEIYIPVLVYNKDYEITQNIPKHLGTFTFDNISYDGDTWTFGTIRSNIFNKEPDFYRLGNYRLSINTT